MQHRLIGDLRVAQIQVVDRIVGQGTQELQVLSAILANVKSDLLIRGHRDRALGNRDPFPVVIPSLPVFFSVNVGSTEDHTDGLLGRESKRSHIAIRLGRLLCICRAR